MNHVNHDLLPNLQIGEVLPSVLKLHPEIRVIVIRSIDSSVTSEDLG